MRLLLVVAGEGGVNPVDPHPISDYGEVLHTSLGVLDMFPGVKRMRMVLSSLVNVGLGCARGLCPLDRS
ncbi:hypothetical protein Hanom_Chr16g01453341 [Helianthus anomalus]